MTVPGRDLKAGCIGQGWQSRNRGRRPMIRCVTARVSMGRFRFSPKGENAPSCCFCAIPDAKPGPAFPGITPAVLAVVLSVLAGSAAAGGAATMDGQAGPGLMSPSGTTLTAYTGPMTITKAGTVIEGQIINGSLTILAPDVIIKNCVIVYRGTWGIDAEGAKNITIQNCDITGPGYSSTANAAILGSGTFIGNDISKSENGIVLTGGASTVRGNYIHDLQAAGSDPHYDGISVQGGQNGVLIEANTIIGRDTSDIFIKNDFGPISNVTVRGNLLLGDSGYPIYVDGRASGGPITGVSITANYVQKGGYGYYSVDDSRPAISSNVEVPRGLMPQPGVPPGAPAPLQ